MNERQYITGELVKVDKRFSDDTDAIGYVYEQYQDFDDSSKFGVSIILKNGRDLGGFSYKEQQMCLEYVRNTGISYQFENVTKLHGDYRAGLFEMLFELETK